MKLRNLTGFEILLLALLVAIFLAVAVREMNPDNKPEVKTLVKISCPLSDGNHTAYLLLKEDKSITYEIGVNPQGKIKPNPENKDPKK